MGNIGYKGYNLHISGNRVEELLYRDFIVPTIENPPDENTLSWMDGTYTHLFSIGDYVRVIINGDIKLYQLLDINSLNKAVWKEVILEHQDLSNYTTKEWIEEQNYLTEHQDISGKQDVLVSGINIKTINGKSLLGEGNIQINGGTSAGGSEVIILTQSEYNYLLSHEGIKDTSIYFIKNNNIPEALYIGTILIAQKDELGNISFPYNFPIIF